MLKQWLFGGALGLSALAPALAAEEVGEVVENRLAEYRKAAQDFGAALKQELTAGIASGGPVAAVGICQSKAMLVAQEYSEKYAWRIGRTSLKARNPQNAPDAWEKKVLEEFEARKAQGEAPETLEFARIIEENGEYQIRYMKAIPAAEMCLTCHGAELAPEVQARVRELYPEDQATGFKAGDLRGAFTITQKLSAPCVAK